MIAAVTQFCPRVEAVEPGVCAFGVRGPARYFGGEAVLAGKIAAAIAELGVTCHVAIADGLFTALLAARAGAGDREGEGITHVPARRTREFLARQPVSMLDDPDLAGLLSRLGIRTLGDLAALPEQDVASRFGAAGQAAHRLARGLGSRPLAPQPPADDLSVAQEFDPPETLADPLVFAAKMLAERMHGLLAAKGLACVRVQVQARWVDGQENSRLWRHDGLLTAVQVADRVRWQLDGWCASRAVGTGVGATLSTIEGTQDSPDPIRAGPGGGVGDRGVGGVVLLRLVPDQVVRATGHQLALWGEDMVANRVARAAMRVQAMLGHESVLRPLMGGGRNVDEQVTHLPFGENRKPGRPVHQPWPGRVPGAAPALVFPVARAALVTDDGGRPVTVSGRCVVSAAPAWLAIDDEPPREITGWAGPWPLTERWWDPAAARRRARFQLVTDDGRAWLAVVQDGRWRIEAGYS